MNGNREAAGEPEPLADHAYCDLIIRFIADQMLDPHRYFEQKLIGQLRAVTTSSELDELITMLIGWVYGDLLEPRQRQRLDDHLARHGGPTASFWRMYPQQAAQLFGNRIGTGNSDDLHALLDLPALTAADRALIGRMAGRA